MEKKVLLAGEAMGLLMAVNTGPLERSEGFDCGIAGAEFNVATGLSRLGHKVSYLTKVGNDPFGRMIINRAQSEGMDCSLIATSTSLKTGYMMKSLVTSGDPEIFYCREGSAASTLDSEDIGSVNLSSFSYLHLTGILPALSQSCQTATFDLAMRARDAGLFISFDPNIRPQLWPSQDRMVAVLNTMAVLAGLVMPGLTEGRLLCGDMQASPLKVCSFFNSMSCDICLKLGSEGAIVAPVGGAPRAVSGFVVDKVVDTVGAGDGFACGVLSALVSGADLYEAARVGCAIGARQCTFRGDNEGLPTPAELDDFIRHTPEAPLPRLV